MKKKKIILTIVFLIFLTNLTTAYEYTLYQNDTQPNAVSGWNFGLTGTVKPSYWAEQFKPNMNISVSRIRFVINNSVSASGTISLWVQTSSAGLPSGTNVTSTSACYIPNNEIYDDTWLNCTFTNLVNLTANTSYWVVAYSNEVTDINRYRVPGDLTGAGKNMAWKADPNPFINYSGYDIPLKIYIDNSTSTSATPVINITNPINNSINNTQIDINLSCNDGEKFNLFFDNNTQPTTQILTNSTENDWLTNVTISQKYYFYANCYNSTTNISSTNSSIYTWTYDLTYPTITINDDTEATISPYGWTYADNDNNLILNLTFTDDNMLYAYEINVSSENVLYYNLTNLSLTGTSQNYYNNFNTTNWTNATYQIYVSVADAHTQNVIPDYLVTKQKSKLTFKTPSNNNIKIETNDLADTGSTKSIDRYSFEFNFTDGLTKNRTFEVKTDLCKLEYLNNSIYKGHFISYCKEATDGNWIDFEGANQNPIVNKIDDYHYQVKFIDLQPQIKFNSIGGLNIYNITLTWRKGADFTQSQGYGQVIKNKKIIDLTGVKVDYNPLNFLSDPIIYLMQEIELPIYLKTPLDIPEIITYPFMVYENQTLKSVRLWIPLTFMILILGMILFKEY